MKNYKEAISDFRMVVTWNHSHVDCWTSLIQVLLLDRQYEEAEKGKNG